MRIRPATRAARCLIAAVSVSVVSACYESPLPLGPPEQGPIDPAYIGTWNFVDPKDAKNVATITTVPFDAHQFFVEWREPADHVTRYRAFATRIGAETLWNVEELDTKPATSGFAFMKARLAADRTLSLTLVQEDALHGLKGAAAIAVINKRVQDPTLYGPFDTCAAEAAPAPR